MLKKAKDAILRVTKNNKGSLYAEFLVGIIIVMMCIALSLTIFSVFVTNNKLENAADALLRQAELAGTTSDLDDYISDLQTETGVSFEVSWDGTEYRSDNGTVQLGNKIVLAVYSEESLSIYGVATLPVTVQSKVYGSSEVYWK